MAFSTLSPSSVLSLFLLVLVAPSLPSASSQACNNADLNTLLTIKKSLGDPPELSSWDPALAPACCSSWRGVGCGTDRRVTSVGIFSTNASGPVPAAFGDLSALRIISLFNLPRLVGPLPTSLTKLPSLAQLTVASTALSGAIPSFLCDLPGLHYIDLSGNRLTGNILPCLMSRASSSGTPPVLHLYQNQLTGPIPPSFANVHFGAIDVSRNQLTGDPTLLFGPQKPSFDEINLSSNLFEFDLSRVRFPLSLSKIDLSHNKIWGGIPQQITRLKKLTYLDVSHNLLCGPIPNMKALTQLPPVLFEGNKCLCGAPLSPCGRRFLLI